MKGLLFLIILIRASSANYWSEREKFISDEFSRAVGSDIVLTTKEEEVNNILMEVKLREFDKGFRKPEDFFAATHFFLSKTKIEESEVFKLIRKLPKGSSLHSHDSALVSFEYFYNLTYKQDLYGCVINQRLHLYFFGNETSKICNWKLISQLRAENPTFDNFLKEQISIFNPDLVESTSESMWKIFTDTFTTRSGMLRYRPIFQDYFYQSLKELYEDNVMYLEFRGIPHELYELNGTIHNPKEVIGIYLEILKQFKHDHPDFNGAKMIYSPKRRVDNKTAAHYITTMKTLKLTYPDFVAGFDLVGEEDKGKPLKHFIPQLLDLSSEGIKFFFHAGETNWYGTSTDFNLVDAVLLNVTRIGHGYAVLKHPKILEVIKEKSIALEISPISNQVLGLVDDLRNHPAAFLLASGYPVVITCDDPSLWGAKALSFDWYMAFMGFGSRESDLRLLKQLAINSITYSAMEANEKKDALNNWKVHWDRFLDQVLDSYSSTTFSSDVRQVYNNCACFIPNLLYIFFGYSVIYFIIQC